MIYIQPFGGLGNQMFQYAAAFCLALKKDTSVGICLDKIQRTANDSSFTDRPFELERVFQLSNFVFVSQTSFNYIVAKEKTIWQKVKTKLKRSDFFYERSLSYDPAINDLTGEAYIEGYFQSQKYFEFFQAEVLKNFRFKQRPSEKTQELVSQLSSFEAVAVHVRRGDFVQVESNLKTHGVCSPVYYEEAARRFDDFHDLCFVVVSDDPEWVRMNINLGQKTIYVDWNQGNDSWQDMLIISKCRHAIIANSSFSWWGAMLIESESKKIIAPARWYADPKLQDQTSDLIPASWIKI